MSKEMIKLEKKNAALNKKVESQSTKIKILSSKLAEIKADIKIQKLKYVEKISTLEAKIRKVNQQPTMGETVVAVHKDL